MTLTGLLHLSQEATASPSSLLIEIDGDRSGGYGGDLPSPLSAVSHIETVTHGALHRLKQGFVSPANKGIFEFLEEESPESLGDPLFTGGFACRA